MDSLIDDGKLPTKAGETVQLRMLEPANSLSKSSNHASVHNRPSTPHRSPSHSPTSTGVSSNSSPGTQTSPLWSPHLYRSSKNGAQSGPTAGTQTPAFSCGGKTAPFLVSPHPKLKTFGSTEYWFSFVLFINTSSPEVILSAIINRLCKFKADLRCLN